jgi:hypothetical protein
MTNYKELENNICGKNNCNKKSEVKIFFDAGFSAWFCAECGANLVQDSLGVELENENDGRQNISGHEILTPWGQSSEVATQNDRP